jgi:ABC-type glycerol-3-phosphate transport system substrate-binding protein
MHMQPADTAGAPAPTLLARRALARAVAGFATGAGALALAACGAPGASGRPDDSVAPRAAAPVTFQYWDWAPVWQELVGELARQFSGTRPNVTVQWEIAADYRTKLQVAVAGDTAPVSWRMNGPNLPQWASLGLLEDLTPRVARDNDATASLKAMAPVSTDYTKRGGRQWTMPFGQASSGIIAYNAELLKQEGLAPPAEL